MKRILLALLLVWGVMLVFPGLRERAEPRIERSREWLGQKLEGPLTPMLTPWWKLQTQTKIRKMTPLLVRDRNRGKPPPFPGEFSEYLDHHGIEPVDAWDSPFILVQEPDSVAIVSPGPDRNYFTDDDMVTKVRYAEIRTRAIWRR